MNENFWHGFEKRATLWKKAENYHFESSNGSRHLNRLSKTASMREVSKVAVIRDGKLLMGRRRDNGKWTEPGGHLDSGESPLMGAARELLEETGIKADPHDFDHLASKLVKKPDGSQILVHAYLLHQDVRLPTTMKGDPDEEVQRWHWVDIAHPRNEEKVLSNMHVPMKDNIVFRGLGLEGGV
jgi:8-oxo-dGTP pyrophosphatase MutT (NUDIX family)